MNALTRIDPLDQFLPDFFRRFSRLSRFGDEMPTDIRLDVTENDKDYVVRAEIPGARKEDVRVDVEGNFVSITAEVRKDTEEKSGRALVRETCVGTASRGLTLASEIDDQGVVAKLEHGVLKLTLPKRASSARRPIAIE